MLFRSNISRCAAENNNKQTNKNKTKINKGRQLFTYKIRSSQQKYMPLSLLLFFFFFSKSANLADILHPLQKNTPCRQSFRSDLFQPPVLVHRYAMALPLCHNRLTPAGTPRLHQNVAICTASLCSFSHDRLLGQQHASTLQKWKWRKLLQIRHVAVPNKSSHARNFLIL